MDLMNATHLKAHNGLAIDVQGIFYSRIRHHDKKFEVMVVPNALQKYVLHESLTGLGTNSSPSLFKFMKRLYYWKGLRRQLKTLGDIAPNINL